MTKTDSENTTASAPFQVGDPVFCHCEAHSCNGTVVDVWEANLSSEDTSWMIVVDHGDFEFAYTPNELSLIPTSKDNNLVLVNFKTKQRRV
jgi:hypothetical protein